MGGGGGGRERQTDRERERQRHNESKSERDREQARRTERGDPQENVCQKKKSTSGHILLFHSSVSKTKQKYIAIQVPAWYKHIQSSLYSGYGDKIHNYTHYHQQTKIHLLCMCFASCSFHRQGAT